MAEQNPPPFYTPLAGESSVATGATIPSHHPQSSGPVGSTPVEVAEKASKTPHFSPEVSKNPLVASFTTLYHSALQKAKKGDDDGARIDYSEMLKLYNQIVNLPDMHDMNRDIAHFCLQDVYDAIAKIGDPGVSRLSFGALIGITLILLVLGGMIATNPSIVGLLTGLAVGHGPAPEWVGGDRQVMISGPTTIHLSDLFRSKDGASLTYLSTSSSTLDAVVSDNYATLLPKYGSSGTTRITLIAARTDDPSVMTKVPVDVTVAIK